VLVALLVVGVRGAVEVGAHAIVDAPNRGHGGTPGELSVETVPPVGGPSRGTIFVLHGIRDGKRSMHGWGRHLSEAGFTAVLVDSRGHGDSPGDWLTYGVEESRDLERLASRFPQPWGVMGVSYGAATAIEWVGRDPRVRAAVAVAPFESLREVVPAYFGRMAPFFAAIAPHAFIDWTLARAGRIGGFNPDEASALDAIARTHAPVLLIHGLADVNIPIAHSRALRDRAPDHVRLTELAGEDHDTVGHAAALWPAASDFLAEKLR
jgi:pimeloyl-ACP methyl ester carboxylesterase